MSFVNHSETLKQNVYKTSEEDIDNGYCDIMFLALYNGEIRLMSYRSNPWKPEKSEA